MHRVSLQPRLSASRTSPVCTCIASRDRLHTPQRHASKSCLQPHTPVVQRLGSRQCWRAFAGCCWQQFRWQQGKAGSCESRWWLLSIVASWLGLALVKARETARLLALDGLPAPPSPPPPACARLLLLLGSSTTARHCSRPSPAKAGNAPSTGCVLSGLRVLIGVLACIAAD